MYQFIHKDYFNERHQQLKFNNNGEDI
jgi:hypothetical protein